MRARGWQSDEDVPRLYGTTVDQPVLVDDADTETGQIIVCIRIHARHFGGLTADEGGAGLFAALCDAVDDVGGDIDVQLSGGIIVKKK